MMPLPQMTGGSHRENERRVNCEVVSPQYLSGAIRLHTLRTSTRVRDSICKGNDVRDDLGDMLVVMINIMERNNISMVDCLEKAWDDIKDRKGRMVDGIFVKEGD